MSSRKRKTEFDWADLKPKFVYVSLDELNPYANNPRVNTASIPLVKNSIAAFGFLVPIVIESVENPQIVAGHTRREAAMQLCKEERRDPADVEVPCILAEHLTEEQIAAFRIADNSVGSKSVWDEDKLAQEIAAIGDAFDMAADFGVDMSFGDEDESDEEPKEASIGEKFDVIVECSSESQMEEVFERLQGEGLKCRISTL